MKRPNKHSKDVIESNLEYKTLKKKCFLWTQQKLKKVQLKKKKKKMSANQRCPPFRVSANRRENCTVSQKYQTEKIYRAINLSEYYTSCLKVMIYNKLT